MAKQPSEVPADIILIRYGELFLKSAYVRNQFERQLIHNLKTVCTSHDIDSRLTRDRGRIYLHTQQIPQTLSLISHVFGITSFSPASTSTNQLPEISTHAKQLIGSWINPTTSFALRVSRSGTHKYSSQDAAIFIGNELVKHTQAPVNLTHPDIELFIEIRNNHSYLYTQKLLGPGGLPLGTQGKVLAILSEPADLLAAWYIIRRGCTPILVLTNPTLAPKLSSFQNLWHITTRPHQLNPTHPTYYQDLATLLASKKCDALITGHTLSDTNHISQIQTYKNKFNVPILSPLIGLTTDEIHTKASEVGLCL